MGKGGLIRQRGERLRRFKKYLRRDDLQSHELKTATAQAFFVAGSVLLLDYAVVNVHHKGISVKSMLGTRMYLSAPLLKSASTKA
jgi:hypothetical protein